MKEVREFRKALKHLIDVIGEECIHKSLILELINRTEMEETIDNWLEENCEADASDKFAEEYLKMTKEYNEKMDNLIEKIDRSEEDECE